ncbi:hypothetical protein IMSHALPRED_008094 [Imshaugia aleurites]|uniref:AT hook domain-containing protein family protein n=1 Tax=Imshaugia aleurites TaxID=172621 RepID=A0A8H3ISL2_9LECA|nr:hypothetical protein IMSHALPRED_008094 [Imshaugia aleurites]
MSDNGRALRSKSTVTSSTETYDVLPSPVSFAAPSSTFPQEAINILAPGSKLPGLMPTELTLLRQKQRKLAKNASSTLSLCTSKHIRNALNATLIFAQYEAGSAVCIDPAGWILTCSHCFGDDEEEYRTAEKRRWLLFYTGLAVQVECRQWDRIRDLALLKILAIESDTGKEGGIPTFSFVPRSPRAPTHRAPIVCIGQPGRDDLESTSSRRTKYNLVEVSEGMFRGMIPGANPDENSDIGTLKHDAWTYWGHSGAPLLLEEDGTLIGLHSSWDDETTMRHGIPLVAIKHFLQERMTVAAGRSTLTSAEP